MGIVAVVLTLMLVLVRMITSKVQVTRDVRLTMMQLSEATNGMR